MAVLPFYSYLYIRRAGANSARVCNEGDVARLVFTEHQAYGLAQVDALSRVDEQASIGISLENLYRIIVLAGHKQILAVGCYGEVSGVKSR